MKLVIGISCVDNLESLHNEAVMLMEIWRDYRARVEQQSIFLFYFIKRNDNEYQCLIFFYIYMMCVFVCV